MKLKGLVNLKFISKMTDHMIEREASGFYLCGSTGEVEERKPVTATDKRVPVVIQPISAFHE